MFVYSSEYSKNQRINTSTLRLLPSVGNRSHNDSVGSSTMTKEEFNFSWPQLDAAVYGIFDSYSQRDALDMFVPLPNPVLIVLVATAIVPPPPDIDLAVLPPSPTIILPLTLATKPEFSPIAALLSPTTTLPILYSSNHPPSTDRPPATVHRRIQVAAPDPPLAVARRHIAASTASTYFSGDFDLYGPSIITIQNGIASLYLFFTIEDECNAETDALFACGFPHVKGARGPLILRFDFDEDNGPFPCVVKLAPGSNLIGYGLNKSNGILGPTNSFAPNFIYSVGPAIYSEGFGPGRIFQAPKEINNGPIFNHYNYFIADDSYFGTSRESPRAYRLKTFDHVRTADVFEVKIIEESLQYAFPGAERIVDSIILLEIRFMQIRGRIFSKRKRMMEIKI
ncbi:hypothetical protein OROHE_012507 [Orobanche hederae]